MIKVIIADDHAVVRKGLNLYMKLEPDVELVGEASDGDEAIRLVEEKEADILLLDIDMPRMNGLTAIRQIREIKPDLKVIILSMHPEEIYGINSRKMGALGYISKDTEPEQVLRAIKEVNMGKEFFSQNTLEGPRTPTRRAKKLNLSQREMEVLKLLSAGKSNKEISAELEISDKTVSTYKQRLMSKIGAKSTVDLIIFAQKYQEA